MSRSIAFLITPVAMPSGVENDNHLRLPKLFAEGGWQVTQIPHDTVHCRGQDVFLDRHASTEFDLIWPIGLGPRQTFLDRQQVLAQIDQDRLITPCAAYMTLHGKSAWMAWAPVTAIANQPAPLIELMHAEGGDWVLKPVAGSYGRDVSRVFTALDIQRSMHGKASQYWMLQRFIPQIAAGETRTLVCDNTIIGSYLRTPNQDMRANLAAQGRATKTQLDNADRQLIDKVHTKLMAHKVGFAAIDTVGGYLMEVNLANPGGLQTLEGLYDTDNGAILLAAIETRLV